MAEDPRNPTAKVPTYKEIAKKKAQEDHFWGYYSRLVENYPGYEEEVGHTSHIAKEYPKWKAF
jgi:hypothetical protein